MQIGELAQRSGLTVHAIRFYEKEGLLTGGLFGVARTTIDITRRGHRTASVLKQAQATGFTLAEVKDLAAAYDAGSLTTQQQSR